MKQTPTRGRPREFDRDVALDRALEVFWKHGYEGAALSDLTRAMGITPPSLYAAFGNKEQLFFHAVERYAAATRIPFDEAPTARAAIEMLLFESCERFTTSATMRGCFVICAATNCGEDAATIGDAMKRRRQTSEAAIRARIERGIADGELPKRTDAHALAKYYATIFQGMSVQARDGATRAELLAVAKLAMKAWPG